MSYNFSATVNRKIPASIARRMQNSSDKTEETKNILRDLAFVLKMTSLVRDEILEEQTIHA